MAFLGLDEGEVALHSYITGVLPRLEHRGIGFGLKMVQREWCLSSGIGTVTWTFDPLLARNAYFNLRKLGAVATRFHRDFYGPMTDAFNADDRTDRLTVRWEVGSPRVEAAVAGRLQIPDDPNAGVLLDMEDGLPRRRPVSSEPRALVRVPPDYLALRRRDMRTAVEWRNAAADVLQEAFESGHRAVDFLREGAYVLERQ